MSNIDTEVKGAVDKIIYGDEEILAVIDLFVVINEYCCNAAVKSPEDYFNVSYCKKIFGESIITHTQEFVDSLRNSLRKELSLKHSLLETLKIYLALTNLNTCLIRVSKASENYENVRIVRAFLKMDTNNFPYCLFKPMALMD